jgi:hypothetical protein
MTKFGLLYDKLIVQPNPKYSAYYQMVRDIIDEMREEYPEDCPDSWQAGLFEDFYKKWFGFSGEV